MSVRLKRKVETNVNLCILTMAMQTNKDGREKPLNPFKSIAHVFRLRWFQIKHLFELEALTLSLSA